MTHRPQPLHGITVIDLGQVYQGPYATLLMAKAGANVIKVEPVTGEPLRARERVGGGAVLPFAMLNANKRDITLNLKSAKGREMLIALCKKGDVLIENYAPGVLDKLGVGAEVLMQENPRLIYASGSGFGLSGPDRDSLAMDLTVQAVSGIMSVTGFPEGPPLKAGPAVADFISGTHLYAGIVTALFERERTGLGRLVEVAMQETIYPTLASSLGMWHGSGGKLPPRTGNQHAGLAMTPYNVYPASDGHIAIICVTEQHWQNLLTAMGREDLRGDERFEKNASRVRNLALTDEVVIAWSQTLPKAEIFEITKQHRIPSAPVRDLLEVVNDAGMHERGMLQWIDHPTMGRIVIPNSPLRFHGTPQMMGGPHPSLGEHNVEVYGEMLGLSEAEVAGLKSEGVI